MAKIYKYVCFITSSLYFYLFITLLFAPGSLFSDLGLTGNDVAVFLAGRASILMLGFSVLLFMAGYISSPESVRTISLSVFVCMTGLSVMSGYEYLRGFVNSGIIFPLVVEALTGFVFLVFAVTSFKKTLYESTFCKELKMNILLPAL